jgi:hypothetical protein
MMDRVGAALGGSDDVVIIGKIVLMRDGQLTIELVVPHELDWQPEDITLLLGDGSTVDVEVVSNKSTRFGEVPAGRTLRLTLRHEGELSAMPTHVEMTIDGGAFTIRL